MPLPLTTAGILAALALLAAAFFPAARRAATWFAVAAIGQGASLSMVVAGTPTRYQHYLPPASLLHEHSGLLALIGLQALIVAVAWRGEIRRGAIGARLSGWRVAIALVLSTATAATVSPGVGRYLSELAFAAAVQLITVATVTLMVLALPASGPALDSLPDDDAEPTPATRPDAPVWMAAILATVLAAALNVFAYDRQPHVPDEVVYLHHAKYLAQGMLTMPALPVPSAFDVDLMEYEAHRWYSPVPPGWPFVLAAGAWAGVPWLVNPLLAGLNVLLAYVLVAHIYSRRIARVTAALLAVSPWFVFLGMSYMPHQLTLLCALIAAIAVVRARQTGTWWWGLAAGAGVGATSLIRPLDGVIVGALIAIWSIGFGGSRLRLAPLAGLALGTLAIGALVFPYNRMLTGDPLTFPINAYVNEHYAPNANAYGFGPDRGMGWPTDPNPGHTPLDGVINANLNTFGINTDLFGWATGSLLFVTWLVASGAWRRQDSVMMAAVLGFGLAYFPYYFSGGPDFGARYWFPIIVPLVALTVRGIFMLERTTGTRVRTAATLMCLMTLVTYVPWRAADKYHNYRGMTSGLRQLAEEHQFGADLVLVAGKRFPDYASAFASNPVNLRDAVPIYAWDRDAATRAAVLREYADRRVWLVNGPSLTGRGYQIAAGPISARALLAGQDPGR